MKNLEVDVCGGRKNVESGENPSTEAQERTNKQPYSNMMASTAIEYMTTVYNTRALPSV